jgi:hypothetical protein
LAEVSRQPGHFSGKWVNSGKKIMGSGTFFDFLGGKSFPETWELLSTFLFEALSRLLHFRWSAVSALLAPGCTGEKNTPTPVSNETK